MADTPRSAAFLTDTSFASGQINTISSQQLRDFVVTVVPSGAIMTSGSSLAMTSTYLVVNKTSGSATAVTLPSSPVAWTQTYTVKDGKGDAGTNNITLTPASGTIDGQANYVMQIPRQAVSLLSDGTNWYIV
jgi:hypothetical protein